MTEASLSFMVGPTNHLLQFMLTFWVIHERTMNLSPLRRGLSMGAGQAKKTNHEIRG